ncbi:class I SAM-dependent methyltransferase [Candidatus Uhrbacteria bacterium]|nr:class I SAM-dependent methyltransferase [Candidatus Uhrbacteria bacterium]
MKAFLRKYAAVYFFLQRARYALLQICEHIIGTTFQECRWRIRHLLKPHWADDHIKSVSHPHRAYWIEKVGAYAPVKTVLEIGCNAGPNLSILSRHFPDIQCYGIDINRNAIANGGQWFVREHLPRVELAFGKADDLRRYKDKSIDVVMSDATLLYVGPDKIKKVLSEIERVCVKAMIFLEFHEPLSNLCRLYDARWIYNYEMVCQMYLPSATYKLSKLPKDAHHDPSWQMYGFFIEISLPR